MTDDAALHLPSANRRARPALAAGGLSVLDGPGWGDFAHRVDRSIARELVVARRD